MTSATAEGAKGAEERKEFQSAGRAHSQAESEFITAAKKRKSHKEFQPQIVRN